MLSRKIFILFFALIFSYSCSSSYEFLSNNSFNPPDDFSKYLLNEYQNKADFEAIKMHDWNSAKLYSEKALKAANGTKLEPEIISYWKIPKQHLSELEKGYHNLMQVYETAIKISPYNLAVAISSLDCWAEQQEENWQTWDIEKCKNDYLNAMHNIYNTLSKKEISESNNVDKKKFNVSASIITKNENDEILQIIYFDFDKSSLNKVSLEEIKIFLKKYNNQIKKYLIIGHTDTMGTKKYNYKLSLERAVAVRNILIENNINEEDIEILAKGEDDLLIKTADQTKYPANRRAEITLIN